MDDRQATARRFLEREFSKMTEGQFIVVPGRVMSEAYPANWLHGWSVRDKFMENMIGSAWGTWTCELEPFTGDYRIGRGKEGNKRRYVSVDRAHLYREINGEFVHKDDAALSPPPPSSTSVE